MNRVSCISVDIINADKPPAALAFLAGACERANLEYHCLSMNSQFIAQLNTAEYNNIYSQIKLDAVDQFYDIIKNPVENIIQQIQEFKSDVILISLFSYMQFSLAEFFLRQVKARLPAVTIIAGGPGINHVHNNSTNGKRLLIQQLIDYYCLGEGDQVLPLLLQGETSQLGLNSAEHQFETWVPQIDNLDAAYVVPSYQRIAVDQYHNLENKNSAVFSLSTSRGCVRSCSFCDVAATWKKFRYRSGPLIAQEVLKHHRDVGAVHFTIVDSLINGSLKSFREFNSEMIKLKEQHSSLAEFSYNGMFIVRDIKSHNEEFFKIIAAAGCESISIGVETGSDRLRADMNKKFTNRDLDHHLEMCQKYGIKNTLLMFVGYPTETAKDFEDTLHMLDRYQHYLIDKTILGINHSGVFSMLPDTPVYHQASDLGISLFDDVDSANLVWQNNNNPDLNIKERILRDLMLRQKALDLRYPVPYATRYLEYLKHISVDFLPVAD